MGQTIYGKVTGHFQNTVRKQEPIARSLQLP